MKPNELFVFVGAGASYSPPCNLPVFNQIRDHILRQLGLQDYVPVEGETQTAKHQVAAGLVPEPFLSSIDDVGIPVDKWFTDVLEDPEPNAVHTALADIAIRGGRVWTVNFDTAIERAAENAPLTVASWPSDPNPNAQLHKPHGSVGGPLIATADQVLVGLTENWLRQLENDVRRRTVVFLGYSGRDLDLFPLWNDVLDASREVLWFDFPAGPNDTERQYKMRLSYRAFDVGKLTFLDTPIDDTSSKHNPSWSFVDWVERNQLATVPIHLKHQLLDDRTESKLPDLPRTAARMEVARLLEMLGDLGGARSHYFRAIRQGPERWSATTRLARLSVNHGSRPMAVLLDVAWRMLPPIGRIKAIRQVLRSKSLSIRFNMGNHRTVVRATRNPNMQVGATVLTLRSGSLRMVGDLDEAVAAATRAVELAIAERHRYRAANAAFQHGMSLMWAGRIKEAWIALHDSVRPRAGMAASRWVAWADFIEGSLLIHQGNGEDADRVLEVGKNRFLAESLMDGAVSTGLVQLTALRLLDDSKRFLELHAWVGAMLNDSSGTYYSRGHAFTAEALLLEEAEFCRTGGPLDLDLVDAFSRVAKSNYPVHSASGSLGLASVCIEKGDLGQAGVALRRGFNVAESVHARNHLARAASLQEAMSSPGIAPDSWYHP